MKNIRFYCFSAIVTITLLNCSNHTQTNKILEAKSKDSIWGYTKRASYASRNNDSINWNASMLKGDLDTVKNRTWPTNPALSDYPSAVSKYRSAGGGIAPLELEINGKNLKGKTIRWTYDTYRKRKDSTDFVKIYFNILYLTDIDDPKFGASQIVSRNYPHYLSTGKQKTSFGSIDWVQMNLANGHSFAIINQRYFDLEFGNTILIVPHNDGSLRFLQRNYYQEPLPYDYSEEYILKKRAEFYEKLKNDEQVAKTLSHPNVINQ